MPRAVCVTVKCARRHVSEGLFVPTTEVVLPSVAVHGMHMAQLDCLVLVTQDAHLRAVHCKTGREQHALPLGYSSMPTALAKTGESRVAVGYHDGAVRCASRHTQHSCCSTAKCLIACRKALMASAAVLLTVAVLLKQAMCAMQFSGRGAGCCATLCCTFRCSHGHCGNAQSQVCCYCGRRCCAACVEQCCDGRCLAATA
jgi:hypothetical protein